MTEKISEDEEKRGWWRKKELPETSMSDHHRELAQTKRDRKAAKRLKETT